MADNAILIGKAVTSPDSLPDRTEDCDSKLVITADEGVRGGRKIPLKANVDAAANKTKKNMQ